MEFKLAHTNINVSDLSKSLTFYREALGLHEVRTVEQPDGEFKLVFISDEANNYQIELTWLRDRKEAYNHGDNDLHIAFVTDDYEAAYNKHKKMGCICYENKKMGIYFIADPDGYWFEIIPERR
ncbi:MAG TPA: VOC family protein [Syntrophales bacterium]|nr:VOC family protein [Syntrophales bacterium]HPQ45440.1 VOC family protein [Syntrophales bacterium]